MVPIGLPSFNYGSKMDQLVPSASFKHGNQLRETVDRWSEQCAIEGADEVVVTLYSLSLYEWTRSIAMGERMTCCSEKEDEALFVGREGHRQWQFAPIERLRNTSTLQPPPL